MKRGEVWWVNFEPSVGGEIRKQRPAVIVGNDSANKYLNRVQVAPLTTAKTDRVYPSETLIIFDGKRGKDLASQLTTASKQRLINRAGKLSLAAMQRIEQAIKIQPGLPTN